MFVYRVSNLWTGEVSEYSCESQGVACRATYRRAMSMLREMCGGTDIVPEGCVLHDLPERKRIYIARKYLRFSRVDPESRMDIGLIPLL